MEHLAGQRKVGRTSSEEGEGSPAAVWLSEPLAASSGHPPDDAPPQQPAAPAQSVGEIREVPSPR
eukprot:1385495-Pyramimonas_sp.AAC.1